MPELRDRYHQVFSFIVVNSFHVDVDTIPSEVVIEAASPADSYSASARAAPRANAIFVNASAQAPVPAMTVQASTSLARAPQRGRVDEVVVDRSCTRSRCAGATSTTRRRRRRGRRRRPRRRSRSATRLPTAHGHAPADRHRSRRVHLGRRRRSLRRPRRRRRAPCRAHRDRAWCRGAASRHGRWLGRGSRAGRPRSSVAGASDVRRSVRSRLAAVAEVDDRAEQRGVEGAVGGVPRLDECLDQTEGFGLTRDATCPPSRSAH